MNHSTEYIDISNVTSKNESIHCDLKLSKGLGKYFFKTKFQIEYDTNIECDSSISIIPVLSLVAPIAWARGADIILDRADEAHLNMLQSVRRTLESWHPQFVSNSRIMATNIVDNKFNNDKSALLFSGGIDSITSYLRNKVEHPTLITLLMNEDRYRPYYDTLKTAFHDFASHQGNDIHFIRTDIWNGTNNVVNNVALADDVGLPTWWRTVSHGLVTVGLCAPLTVSVGIGNVRFASAFHDKHGVQEGSFYLSKTEFCWADIKNIHDSTDLTRQQKIRDFLKGHADLYRYLLVCNNLGTYQTPSKKLYPENCGYCEKCLRTIAGLILEGIDPIQCNFVVGDDILSFIQHSMTSGSLNLTEDSELFWRDIQEHAFNPKVDFNDVIGQKYSARKFFDWFKDFDMNSYKHNRLNLLRSEFYFSMKHKGIQHALGRTMRYVSRRSRRKMYSNENQTGESPSTA